jgi:hypothetical protein
MDCLADETTPPDSTWMAADDGDERQHKNTQSDRRLRLEIA